MIKTTMPLLALAAISTLMAGTLPCSNPGTVNWEDQDAQFSAFPSYDRDLNDLRTHVCGVDFQFTAPYHFAGYWSGALPEIPAPDGYYFGTTLALGSTVEASFYSWSSSSVDWSIIYDLETGGYISIPNPGTDWATWGIPFSDQPVFSLATSPGDRLQFFLIVPEWGFYTPEDYSSPDHVSHATFTPDPTPRSDTPEPGTMSMLLAGAGLLGVQRLRAR